MQTLCSVNPLMALKTGFLSADSNLQAACATAVAILAQDQEFRNKVRERVTLLCPRQHLMVEAGRCG